MYNAMTDLKHYDDSEPIGDFVKSADYERDQQRAIEAKRAVREGRASWIAGPLGENDRPDALPFSHVSRRGDDLIPDRLALEQAGRAS